MSIDTAIMIGLGLSAINLTLQTENMLSLVWFKFPALFNLGLLAILVADKVN